MIQLFVLRKLRQGVPLVDTESALQLQMNHATLIHVWFAASFVKSISKGDGSLR